jgi:hypothetical protein
MMSGPLSTTFVGTKAFLRIVYFGIDPSFFQIQVVFDFDLATKLRDETLELDSALIFVRNQILPSLCRSRINANFQQAEANQDYGLWLHG